MAIKIGESSTKMRALVVDDTTIERKVNCRVLRTLNFETFESINGKDAIDRVLSGEMSDLILMDKSMPVMDGIMATKKLREIGGKFKLIALTSEVESKDAFMEAGADEFLAKPLDPKKLGEALKKLGLIS